MKLVKTILTMLLRSKAEIVVARLNNKDIPGRWRRTDLGDYEKMIVVAVAPKDMPEFVPHEDSIIAAVHL